MFKKLTKADLDTLKMIVELSGNEERTIFQDKMTSGIFFDCCKMGLDPDSPEAFEEWFDKREWQFGHPWEVCRGGNSTHISLYVNKKKIGWELSLAGKSRVRFAETVRFAIALYNQNIPFRLLDAKEILAMVSETDYIGIVPEKVMPVYCQSY
jgi:hypothetical protein